MSSADTTRNVIITKEVIKRLIFDVKDLLKFPLDNEGIYYKHDEEDILKGYALIIGPKDSLYSGGYYLFTFSFPSNYPHSPPKVSFCTNDGATRFHPNMYKCGKVCLSVLNTWKGEQWTSCQSIRSVLLTLLSVLDNEPLLHEPGLTKYHADYNHYNDIIMYKNLEFATYSILTNHEAYLKKPLYSLFGAIIKKRYDLNKTEILEFIKMKGTEHKDIILISTSIYHMKTIIDWNKLYRLFSEISI
tara:strand:- start:3685 stop:4419 length:735 start_codon:yes stop_codon:yes gene_type:complete